MIHFKNIKISEYDYTLPDERIARHPLENRDDSKLLVYNHTNSEIITDDTFRNIGNYLPDDSLLILNNTRVIQARILLQKNTGAHIEIFLLEPLDYPDFSYVLHQTGKIKVKCLIGNAKKWKQDALEANYRINDENITLKARLEEKTEDYYIVELFWTPNTIPFCQILEIAGAIPLPPYLGRDAEDTDNIRYQTIFSACKGSVAAPTAGLHFTEHLFEQLQKKNILPTYLTLHVGAGTFKPVKSESVLDHQMHFESISIHRSTIENLLKNHSKPYILVGTTSVRTIESLYWFAMKIQEHGFESAQKIEINQWDAYQYPPDTHINKPKAWEIILQWMDFYKTDTVEGSTQMMIVPGYSFKMTDILITNFHQPCSTLLLLVSAFTNQNWRKIYQHALGSTYRFLSYGDSCLLFPEH